MVWSQYIEDWYVPPIALYIYKHDIYYLKADFMDYLLV